jgi:2-polyprenyl-3-methyl-5-hydroxy-6-metoxy-1,4-benzoquinol methylase
MKNAFKRLRFRIKRYFGLASFTERTKTQWEDQYAGGYWDFLRGQDELPRYSIIAGYCRLKGAGLSILDVGCGEGVLVENLASDQYERFVGIDLSETAIQRARAAEHPNCDYISIDASTYRPESRFDVIIFNEVVSYFSDPVEQIQRYQSFLEHHGVVIVSMHHNYNTDLIWNRIDKAFNIIDENSVANRAGSLWRIKVIGGDAPRTARIARDP